MQRREIGRYEISTTSGERIRAFVPAPLPPDPPLVLDGALQQAFESATLALGRLDGISALLPDQTLFLWTYIRKGGRAFLSDRRHAIVVIRPGRKAPML